jgi:erythromycin esterase-like protein
LHAKQCRHRATFNPNVAIGEPALRILVDSLINPAFILCLTQPHLTGSSMKISIQQVLLILVSSIAPIVCTKDAASAVDESVLKQVTNDLCKTPIVFLGGPVSHGSARSLQFEGAIVQRLVSDCHFSNVVLEAPIYDFMEIERQQKRGEVLSKQQLLHAVGGLWSDAQEFESTAEFLTQQVNAKRVSVYGMSDNIGATGDYAHTKLAGEIASYLPTADQLWCQQKLEAHFAWKYDAAHPYAKADKDELLRCLAAASDKIDSIKTADTFAARLNTASLARSTSRDLLYDSDWAAGFRERDKSMAANFESLFKKRPFAKGTIVWAASIHLAKSLKSVADATSDLEPFGSIVIHDLKIAPFVLATSSLSGTEGRMKPELLPTAPADSLEAKAFIGTSASAVYEAHAKLAQASSQPSRIIGSDYVLGSWPTIVDGVVVFKEDTSVTMIPHG